MSKFGYNFTDDYGNDHTLEFRKGKYCEGNLAIIAYCQDNYFEEVYCVLTKNLGGELQDNQAYLDINNVEKLCNEAINNGWCKQIGTGQSGYVTNYPLVEFEDDFLSELSKI